MTRTSSRVSGRRALTASLSAVLALGVISPVGAAAAEESASGIDPAVFAEPSIDYRPGVRWWWPGNGASREDLLAQVDYLHENGFGAVEIVAFTKGFLTGDGTTTGYIYDGQDLGYDVDQILGYESPEYFDKLDAVVARANELGITVDLNIGSGYLASDDSIGVEDSQSTMALGRATIARGADGTLTVIQGDISIPTGAGAVSVGIPTAEASPFYASEKFGFDFGDWSPDDVDLASVILAPVLDVGAPLATNNQVLTDDFDAVKTYPNQTVVDLQNATVVYPDEGAETFPVDPESLAEGSYEVIALYSAPTGSFGFNSVIENTTTGGRNYVVDHMDAAAIEDLVNGWLDEPALNDIVEDRDVRAAFNDSYEFYTDTHYNEVVQAAAQSEDILGYDITRFLPSFYAFYKDSFLIDGNPVVKDEYSALGMEDPVLERFGGTRPELLAAGLTKDGAARVEYDYGQLINSALLDGQQSFSNTLGEYGILYRQQAYNPPIDTLKSADYVDIPETEGLSEYSLKQVSSGAHLYGKNLVTSEVYTLGSVPFRITPEFIKQGYDLMATSGVNNFFYHGLSATYHGNTDPSFPSDDNLFAEEGWRAWPTIGVEMADTSGISDYYATMNDYASRANYLMQSGTPSSDVAVYMPLFGSLATGGGFSGPPAEPLATITALQNNGYTWNAINDDTIQNGLVWDGTRLAANGGATAFDALVIESSTVPLETMQSLQVLADAGAPITFLGAAPSRQPSYADGDYALLDSEVAGIATALGGGTDGAGLLAGLATTVDAPITYAANTNVRFERRSLPTGGELAYIRNTALDTGTPIDLTVDSTLTSCTWLDPATGQIFAADELSVTLDPAGAVILLCEPADTAIADTAISAGLPEAIDVAARPVVRELTGFELTVTADNIGTNAPGPVTTSVFSDNVLGDWAADSVLGGQLRHVTDAGVYRTSIDVPDAGDYIDGGAILSLAGVHDAATVRINPGTDHALEVQLYAAPFTVNIASALIDGSNTVEIEVQPVQSNRREGLKALYLSDPVANVRYQAYASVQSGTGLMPAGLVGPVTLATAVESAADAVGLEPTTDPTPTPTPTAAPATASTPAAGPTVPHRSTGTPSRLGLAATGADVGTIAAVAGGLLLLGGALSFGRFATRRRLNR
jgi:hypothetical protein